MKKVFNYYIYDSLLESVVGNFDAVNDEVAKVLFKRGVEKNEKLKASMPYLVLVKYPFAMDVLETYQEVVDKCTFVFDEKGSEQLVLEFGKDIKDE